jgi:hypothetical protein
MDREDRCEAPAYPMIGGDGCASIPSPAHDSASPAFIYEEISLSRLTRPENVMYYDVALRMQRRAPLEIFLNSAC